ncbi:MAG: phytanoyl-CoA dioxygenase family protein [Betaproteobacteria bacterium]
MKTGNELTGPQVEAFWRDGFCSPVDAFPVPEADAMRSNLEAFEATLPAGPVAPMFRRRLHVMLPWMRDIAEDPRILDAIESLIGPDILIFTSTFFIKEPRTPTVAAWHQDATYLGLNHEHVSAWVAFSDASLSAGCLRFVRGSQQRGLMKHTNQVVSNSLNVASQAIAADFAPETISAAPLRRGQFSLHHTMVIHESAPNQTNDRRIGVGISYIPTRTKHRGTMRLPATLVRGQDRYGHYDLEPDPRDLTPEEARIAHATAFERYRQGYDEQMRIVAGSA